MSAPSATDAEKRRELNLAYLAAVIGSLVTVTIAILTSARGYLDPFVFNAVIATLVAAIGIVVAYGFAASPLLPRIKSRLREARQESEATQLLPELADLIDQFTELASTRYATGVHQAIQSFQVDNLSQERAFTDRPRGAT